jgi:hypothetical protein
MSPPRTLYAFSLTTCDLLLIRQSPDKNSARRDRAASAPRDRGAAASGADAVCAAGAPAADALEEPRRRLRFEGEGAAPINEDELRCLLEDFNQSLLEQGLSHKQLALAPAAPTSPAQPLARGLCATPLAEAAAGAAAWPQPAPEHGPGGAAAKDAATLPRPAGAGEVARLQARISQLEEQVRAQAAPAAPAPQPQVVQHAVVPVAAGAMYVTHKEMELVQENQALRQQLQQATMGPGSGGGALMPPDGWVTTTRGGTAVDGAPDPVHELWVPASALGGGWGATPLSVAKTGGGILGGCGGLVTPLRGTPPGGGVSGGAAGSTRATPGSEGSVKTAAHTPSSGGHASRSRSGAAPAVGMLPPLRAGSLTGSPSKGSGGGTPRERMAAQLYDSRTRIEQLALNLNVSLVPCPCTAMAGFGREAGNQGLFSVCGGVWVANGFAGTVAWALLTPQMDTPFPCSSRRCLSSRRPSRHGAVAARRAGRRARRRLRLTRTGACEPSGPLP